MDDYVVLVEARAGGGQRIADPDARAGALMSQVAPFHGVCSVGAARWDAQVSIDAADAVEAGAVAAALVRSLAAKAALPPWPIVRVDAVRGDLLGEESGSPGRGPQGGSGSGGRAG